MLEILEWIICKTFGDQALVNFRTRWRSFYPLTLKQRIMYPLFIIRMLNHFDTPEESKLDIIEKFVIPFMNNEPGFREKYSNYHMCFHEKKYIGVLTCDERDLYIDKYIKKIILKNTILVEILFFIKCLL